MTRNKFTRLLINILERIGIKKSKSYVYTFDVNNKSILKKSNISKSILIRQCTKNDLDKLHRNEAAKSVFKNDLDKGHIMIGAFFNNELVAYAWLSFQKVYAPEMGAWADFDGGYLWRGYTKKEYRGKGIGKEIDRHALKITQEKKKNKLFVLVETDNIPAQRTLESIGFKKYKTISYFRFLKIRKRSEKTV